MLVISTVALLGAPASAATPSANSKFCTAAGKIGEHAQNTTTKSTPAALKALGKSINTAAADAPAKIKSAMHAISSYMLTAAAGKPPTNVQQYAKASVVYAAYINKVCNHVTP